jgi:hypothetical protein
MEEKIRVAMAMQTQPRAKLRFIGKDLPRVEISILNLIL